MGHFLNKNFSQLTTPQFKSKYSKMIIDLSVQRGRETIFYYPAYFIKRLIILMIPAIALENGGVQYFLLMNVFIFGIIAYGCMRSHNSFWRRNLEFFNDSCIMMIIYSMVCMTDFIETEIQIFNNGYIFIVWLVFLFLGNMTY